MGEYILMLSKFNKIINGHERPLTAFSVVTA